MKFPVLFKEETNFKWGRPRYVNDHHLEFGYFGDVSDKKILFTEAFKQKGKGFLPAIEKKIPYTTGFNP